MAPEQLELPGIPDFESVVDLRKLAREKGWDNSEESRYDLYEWAYDNLPKVLPKSKMGKAIKYAMRNWQALTRFILDPTIPPDNNRSENALRIVALLRKNSLFAHDPDTADNLAALLTVVATCVANGLDPVEYLSDVLLRVAETPKEELGSLIPGEWKPRG